MINENLESPALKQMRDYEAFQNELVDQVVQTLYEVLYHAQSTAGERVLAAKALYDIVKDDRFIVKPFNRKLDHARLA